jgi:hypothetical protein
MDDTGSSSDSQQVIKLQKQQLSILRSQLDATLKVQAERQLKADVSLGWESDMLSSINMGVLTNNSSMYSTQQYPIHPSVTSLMLQDLLHCNTRAIHLLREVQKSQYPLVTLSIPEDADINGVPTIAHVKGVGATILSATKKLLVHANRNRKILETAGAELNELRKTVADLLRENDDLKERINLLHIGGGGVKTHTLMDLRSIDSTATSPSYDLHNQSNAYSNHSSPPNHAHAANDEDYYKFLRENVPVEGLNSRAQQIWLKTLKIQNFSGSVNKG